MLIGRHVLTLAATAALAAGVGHARVGAGHDQDRRDQQLQDAAGVPRAVSQGLGARGRRGERRRRRVRPQARGRLARRQRQSGRRGAARRGARLARERAFPDRDLPLQHRPRGRRLREAEEGAVHRRRAADRQDRVGERQPVHVPAAALDLHADGDARARRGEAEEEALGDRLPELRVRPVRDARVQGAAEEGAARRRVRRRAGGAARQDRRRRGGAGARRREARRDLLVALRRRSHPLRARRQHARPLQGTRGVQPARRRAGVPRSAQGRDAERLVRHRLSVERDQHAGAQERSSTPTRSAGTTIRGSARSSATRRS